MALTRGSFRGYEYDRMVILFSMVDGQTEIPCAISTTAMDDLESLARSKPDEREAQFMRLRDRQGIFENQLLSVPAASWPEAAAKARYVLNLYVAGLAPADSHHRDLVAAVLADFARLSDES